MGFMIRRAAPSDEKRILELWTQLVAYHKSIEHVRPRRWSGEHEAILRPLLSRVWQMPDREAIFVAERDGGIVGFVRVALSDDGPRPARIETLFVSDESRGRGWVGTWWGPRPTGRWAAGPGRSRWTSSRPTTTRAFYERMGFRPLLVTSMRASDVGEDPPT